MNEIIVEETGLPLKFPDWREEVYQRAQEFRRLSSTDRLREIAGMMALGVSIVQASSRRAMIGEFGEAQEAEEQRIQRELLERYGG